MLASRDQMTKEVLKNDRTEPVPEKEVYLDSLTRGELLLRRGSVRREGCKTEVYSLFVI